MENKTVCFFFSWLTYIRWCWFFVLQAVDVENMHVLHHYDVHKLCNLILGSDRWEVSQFLLNWKLWTRDKCIYRHQAVFERAWGTMLTEGKHHTFDGSTKSQGHPPVGCGCFRKWWENTPQIIPCLVEFSIIFTIHFGVPLLLETPMYSKARAVNPWDFKSPWTPPTETQPSRGACHLLAVGISDSRMILHWHNT